jgi:hypothetical protein
MVAWTHLVQSHPDYSVNLQLHVDGKIGDLEFIDFVGDIIGARENERTEMRLNFESALDALGVSSL